MESAKLSLKPSNFSSPPIAMAAFNLVTDPHTFNGEDNKSCVFFLSMENLFSYADMYPQNIIKIQLPFHKILLRYPNGNYSNDVSPRCSSSL